MSHVLLVLPNPDWIQLTNVYLKFDKHLFTEAYTLTTLPGKLASLTQNSKIHVIGHGNCYGPQHSTVPGVAQALKDSGMPDNGTTIRLDTCSSAGVVPKGLQNFAQNLSTTLKASPFSFKNVKVEGTVGASITGFKEGREVVDPATMPYARDAQGVMSVLFYDEISQAASLIAKGWRENLSSSDIRMLAFQVHLKTSEFFKCFRKYLINFPKVKGTPAILLDKQTAHYKDKY